MALNNFTHPRYTYPDKKNIRCGGSVLQFLWHFSSISARVLALSLFATAFPRWVGPVCAAHVLLMTTWILAQRVDACSTAGETLLFALVLGVVYIFSFFNAKEERTRSATQSCQSCCSTSPGISVPSPVVMVWESSLTSRLDT